MAKKIEIIGVFICYERLIMDFKSLKPYVRQAIEQSVKAPSELPTRWLVSYQITIITEGRATMFFNEKPYKISAGDVLFIPPNEPHRYNVSENITKLMVYFDADYSEISRTRNISFSVPPESLSKHGKRKLQTNIYKNYPLPFIFKPDNFESYIELWCELRDSIKKNNSYSAEIRMTKLLNLVHEKLGITKIRGRVDFCEAVKDYIDAGFERILTLEEICELYQINKFTISKKFKQRYGTSIIAYYNEKRLAYAKAELSKKGASVTRISEYLNFTDVYTFSKFFKIHTGVAPRTYKESCQKKNEQE